MIFWELFSHHHHRLTYGLRERAAEGEAASSSALEELAAWFHRALADAGHGSVHEFLRLRFFEKNAVYGVFAATRLLTLELTQSLAVALKRNAAQVVPIWTRAREARDRATLATLRAKEPRIASWAELPVPSLALSNLLEAQSASVERASLRAAGRARATFIEHLRKAAGTGPGGDRSR